MCISEQGYIFLLFIWAKQNSEPKLALAASACGAGRVANSNNNSVGRNGGGTQISQSL
jgi:hypothetical protein